MFYVYKLTNIQNRKIYIGKANKIKARWSKHLSCARIKNPHDYSYIHRAINKWGAVNFTIEQVAEYETEQESLLAEMYYITYYNSTDRSIGYNISPGGDSPMTGRKHKQSTKDKISKANTGKIHSEESRKRMGDAHRSSKRNEITKQKMRIARAKQAPMSEETCKKISQAKIGTKMSKESSIKKSFASRGEKNKFAKITEQDVIKIKQLRKAGKKRSQIQKELNIPLSTIDCIIYNQSWTHIII